MLCKIGSGSRYNKSRFRKRKGLAGNLGNSTDNDQQQVQLPTSASAKKLKTSSETEISCGIAHGCNFMIDSDLFIPLVTMIGRGPECVVAVNIQHMIGQKMGLAQFFAISCTECDWRINFCSSTDITKSNNSQGRKSYEVNRRTLVAFRENGLGFNGMKIFCCFMNMQEPMAQTTYDEINSELYNAYVGTAQESIEKAAHEICDLESQKLDDTASNTDIDSVLDTKVSDDGAWQKRGYSSLNGVVTLIGNGKCINYEVLSKKHSMCVQSITQEVQELWKSSTCRKCLVDLSTSTVYDIPFTLEMVTPNHLTRILNLTPTLATPLQKENVLVMSKKELVPDFAMSKANIKGKSFGTATVSVALKDA